MRSPAGGRGHWGEGTLGGEGGTGGRGHWGEGAAMGLSGRQKSLGPTAFTLSLGANEEFCQGSLTLYLS